MVVLKGCFTNRTPIVSIQNKKSNPPNILPEKNGFGNHSRFCYRRIPMGLRLNRLTAQSHRDARRVFINCTIALTGAIDTIGGI
jgi:hypothetical protein